MNIGQRLMKTEDQNQTSLARMNLQRVLFKILASSTKALFEKLPLKEGMQGLDLGCAAGENTLLLKEFVGIDGKITGIDSNADLIEMAKEIANQYNEYNVAYRRQSILEWKETKTYDFVYSNLFLRQTHKPLTILRQIYNSLKPSGFAIIEGLDYSQLQCFPSCFAFDRCIELIVEIKRRQGLEANIGKRFPTLFQQAGFKNSQVQLVRPNFLSGKDKRVASLTLESIASLLLKEKLTTTTELQALLFELKDFEQQKNTLITLPGIYQIWGYRL